MSKRLRLWLIASGGALALALLLGRTSPSAAAWTGTWPAAPDARPPQDAQAGADTRNAPPPMPYIEADVCPFECCTYRDWKASRSITAHDRWKDPRSSERQKVAFGIARGETVTAMTGFVMTTKPGRARSPKDGVLDVAWTRFIGRRPEKLPLHAGDVIYLLAPHSDRTYSAWHDGLLLDRIVPVVGAASAAGAATGGAAAPAPRDAAASAALLSADQPLEVIEQPTYEWWVRVRNEQGEVGWTDRPYDFSGADACRTALPSRGVR